MRFSYLFIIATLIYSFNSIASTQDYVVGGEPVKSNDPIQASTVGIFEPSPDGQSGSLCTGTLVRKDMALTAAHCLSGDNGKASVIFGPNLHSALAPHRTIQEVAINPKWANHSEKSMDQGDIALVKFKGGLPQTYKPIAALGSEREIKAGGEVTLAGYGISDAQNKTGAGELRKARVRIEKNRPGKSEMILDQSHGQGACHGDSGGPAFLRQGKQIKLAGVTNRAYPNHAPDDCAHRVVYTKVPAYESWIKSSERKLAKASEPNAPLKMKTKMTRVGHLRNSKIRVQHARISRIRSHHQRKMKS